MNPVYFVVFIDAMLFATVVTKVTSSSGLHFTAAYAAGRTLGVFIGNKIEERLALGILEVDIFIEDKAKMIKIAEMLRTAGYTVNNFIVRGVNGGKGYKIEVVIKRNEFKTLETIMGNCGVNNPTLKVKNLSKVYGSMIGTKIKTT